MDSSFFWSLVERSREFSNKRRVREDWLTRQLSKMPLREIIEFQVCIERLCKRSDTWSLRGAVRWIRSSESDDIFRWFQLWLIGLGREVFEKVAADPEALATVPEFQALGGRVSWPEDVRPEWESLDYVAADAYEMAEGDGDEFYNQLKHFIPWKFGDPAPSGKMWDINDSEEARRRYPAILSVVIGSRR